MKKNDEAYGDIEGSIYPFSSCSSIHVSSASSSSHVMGYTLQEMELGASGLRVMAWSKSLDGGKRCDSSSLNTLANCRYSLGILAAFVYC